MATPITWRNVNGPSPADALRPMEAAQRSFSGAFDGLSNVLKQREATDIANWGVQKENNTQAALDQIAQYGSPEEFQAAQKAGVINALLSANGAQIDRAAVRTAQDGRLGILQGRAKAAGEYQDYSTDRKQLPIVQEIMGKAALGDKDGALALMKSNPDLRMPAPLMQAITTGDRDMKKFGFMVNEDTRKGAEDLRKAELQPIAVAQAQDNLLNGAVQRARDRAAAAASGASVDLAREQLAMTKEDRIKRGEQYDAEVRGARAAAARKIMSESGNMYSEGAWSPQNAEPLLKSLVDSGLSGDQGKKLIARITKLGDQTIEYKDENGKIQTKKMPIPLAKVKELALGAENTFLSWNEGYADTFEKRLKAAMNEGFTETTDDGKKIARNKAVEDLRVYMGINEDISENPFLGKKPPGPKPRGK